MDTPTTPAPPDENVSQPPQMTPAEIEAALAEAAAFGVDLDALRENLQLTTEQRLARLQAGLRMVATLRNAREA